MVFGTTFYNTIYCRNHENYSLLNKLPHYNWNGITVRYVCNKVYHLMNGIYTINNKKILAIGGAESHDKEWRVENVDWWEQELPSATQLGNLKMLSIVVIRNLTLLSHTALLIGHKICLDILIIHKID